FDDFTAVDNMNIEVPSGSMYGFLGGNGAGKTTTFRMLLGLLTPTAGNITYNDKKIDYVMTDKIGYLPEERGLHPKLQVDEQIQYLAKLKGMKKADIDKQLDFWLEEFEVPENKQKRSEEHTSELQSRFDLVCRLL